MSLFDKRWKMDVETMGKFIFKIVDERTGDMFRLFFDDSRDDISIDFEASDLMFYTFAINYYFIGNILNSRNSASNTARAMASAFDCLYNELTDMAGVATAEKYKKDFPNILSEVSQLCSANSSADLDNAFSRLCKYYLSKIYHDNRYAYESLILLEFSEIMSCWINNSMFLVEKYKLVR